jgi:beta-glucosidase
MLEMVRQKRSDYLVNAQADWCSVKAGETRMVDFVLQPHQFAARNEENIPMVEAGRVLISVGGKQPDDQSLVSGNVIQKSVEITGNRFYVND